MLFALALPRGLSRANHARRVRRVMRVPWQARRLHAHEWLCGWGALWGAGNAILGHAHAALRAHTVLL